MSDTRNGYDKELIEYFMQFISPERRKRLYEVLQERSRYLAVVLEDIYQPHNASAVLRSCDAFGIQDVHVIENRNSFRISDGVALGTGQWLDIHRWRDRDKDNTRKAVLSLKEEGYRIVATSPHTDDVNLEEFDLEAGKAAFLFGNELDGLSPEAMELADEYMKIPMHGFVESLNISVCCAVTLHHLSWKLRRSETCGWRLSPEERERLLLGWLRGSVKNASRLEEHFNESLP